MLLSPAYTSTTHIPLMPPLILKPSEIFNSVLLLALYDVFSPFRTPEIDTPTRRAHLALLQGRGKSLNYSPQLGDDLQLDLPPLDISPHDPGSQMQLPPLGPPSPKPSTSASSYHIPEKARESAEEGIFPEGINPLPMDSSGDELDEKLETKSKAQHIKLTAKNVRSILRVSLLCVAQGLAAPIFFCNPDIIKLEKTYIKNQLEKDPLLTASDHQ